MIEASNGTVAVTRRIEAPAADVFALLVDPATHPSFDGSGMLRDGTGNPTVTAAGDVFTIRMYNAEMGDYEMRNHVVDFVPDRRIVWEPVMSAASRAEDLAAVGDRAGHRWGYELEPDGPDATIVTEMFDCSQAPEWLRTAIDEGNRWLDSMAASLERLEQLCSYGTGGAPSAA